MKLTTSYLGLELDEAWLAEDRRRIGGEELFNFFAARRVDGRQPRPR